MAPARRVSVVLACVLACAAPLAASELKLEIQDGKVTLVATDVPARQILSEWARIGQTKIVNAEKLPVTMLTLRLEGVSERQALDTVLRSASGYIAMPRMEASAAPSVFDRIIIMPTSTVVANANVPRPVSAPLPPPPVQTFRPGGFPVGDAVDDQDHPVPQPNPTANSPVAPGMPGYVPPPPVAPPGAIPPYPGAPSNVPPGQQAPQPTPQNPWGVTPPPGGAVPGFVTPPPGVPQTPGVVNPLQPRRPGGN